MSLKFLATALVTTALMTGVASAQTATGTKPDAKDTSATMHRDGEWRASKLVGVNVYNEANEKIGDINEVILDKSGRAANVILGVGGFLGMGEHYRCCSLYDKLKWVNEPPRSTATTSANPPANNKPATTVDSNARTAADGTRTEGEPALPRPLPLLRAQLTKTGILITPFLIATKDQLKSMPQFKY